MKPYPLASLNHFTFPLAIRAASYWVGRSCLQLANRAQSAPYGGIAPHLCQENSPFQVLIACPPLWRELASPPCRGRVLSGVRSLATRSRAKSAKAARPQCFA